MNQDLAREVLLRHSHSSKNGKFPETTNSEAKLTNPLCGDHVELKIYVDETHLHEIGFKAVACAICTASASLLAEQLQKKSLETIRTLSDLFETNVMGTSQSEWPHELKAFECFEHLRVNPSRKVCALLPWVALKSALKAKSLSETNSQS